MGPRHFIAPELEGGGRLDAGPAADIYSLGKVIYYMVSGGVVLPRERLDEAGYREIFDSGQRFQLLGLLLRKMICPPATRLQAMSSIIEELDRIEAWERKAPLLAVSPLGLAAAEQLRRNAIERSQARESNQVSAEDSERRLAVVTESVLEWVRSELTDVAEQFHDGTALKIEVRDATVPTIDNNLTVQTSDSGEYLSSIGGLELSLREAGDGFVRRHSLLVLLWQKSRVSGNMGVSVKPPRDVQLALVPMYRQTVDHEAPRASQMLGYLSKPEKVGTTLGPLRQPGLEYFRVEPVTQSFRNDVTQCVRFRLSEWPARQEELRTALAIAVGSFIEVVQSRAADSPLV
jgi:hypothetical protein